MAGVSFYERNDERNSADIHQKVHNECQGTPASWFDGAAGYLRTDHLH